MGHIFPLMNVPMSMFQDAEGRPVEVNEMTADASAYVFRYEFSA